MTGRDLSSAVATARAIGHPARLRTLNMLRSGELCVCQITAVLGLAPSTVSAHLRELRQAGLTVERKEGRWVYVGMSDGAGGRQWVDSALAAAEGDEQLVRDASMVGELRSLPVEDLCSLGYEGAVAKNRDCGGSASNDREIDQKGACR